MLLRDKEIDYDWDRHGEPVLYAIEEAAASRRRNRLEDVLDILGNRHGDWESAQMGEECEFDPDSHYERKRASSIEIAAEWYGLERSLKLRSRYFNPQAESLMSRLFGGLDQTLTHDGRGFGRGRGGAEPSDQGVPSRQSLPRCSGTGRGAEAAGLGLGPPPGRGPVA